VLIAAIRPRFLTGCPQPPLRDKLLGTLVLPGGLFGSAVGILRMPGDLAHPSVLITVAQVALLLAPIYTAAHLGHRLRTVRRLAPAAVEKVPLLPPRRA
jgi:hypothetical protein